LDRKRKAILTATILMVAAALLAHIGLASKPRPNISIRPMVWKLGTVSPHRDYKQIFEVRNRGDGLLLLKDVRSTCGCAVTEISTTEVPPHDRVELEITFNEEPTGIPVTKRIYITSNDPFNEILTLKIKAEVLSE